MTDLATIPCKCSGTMTEHIRHDDKGSVRLGWTCECGHEVKAIGRERVVIDRAKQEPAV